MEAPGSQLAVIGLACRVPGAENVEAFWESLCSSTDAITDFSDDELRAEGVAPERFADPSYVRARGVVAGADRFDAAFFGYTPREAALTDPQHRLFLEGAWHALEDAGSISGRPERRVGVFAGCAMNSYLLNNIARDRELLESTDHHQLLLAGDKDFLATRVSYKLDLTGPSISVATACSTSLVAVHQAAQSILNGECDVAVAGGVSIPVPLREGFLIKEDGVLSRHGRCRSFDAAADGIGAGSGFAIVVLARLDDALADGSRIYALLRGSAINNDGALKTGFTAPSVQGQALVISEALAAAGVDPATVGYVEAHGTGTRLGDPIEVAALTQAYRAAGARGLQYCALGSVKSNIGHLDAAAGAIGLIKAALMLYHRRFVPSLHFTNANPEIDFAGSPFFVNTELREWEEQSGLRRAAVSSFGLGGTNAHAILEEAPAVPRSRATRAFELLLLSAKSDCALERASAQLDRHLERHPEIDPADAAFTLSRRRAFDRRRAFLWEISSGRRFDVTGGVPDGDERLLALGRAWATGERIDPELVCANEGRHVVSLPGYPFEPESHWIGPRMAAAPPAASNGVVVPHRTSTDAVLTKVRGIIAGISGVALDEIGATSDVFDVGLDSLALIQVNRALKDELGVTLSLSDLLTDLSVVGALADRVAELLSAQTPEPEPEATTEAVPPVPSPPIASPAIATLVTAPDARTAIIEQQLEIMRMQLALLGTPAEVAASPAIAAAPPGSSAGSVIPPKKPLGFASRLDAGAGPPDGGAQERLRALVERYTARTRRSKEYAARYRDPLADSRATVGFRRSVKEMLYPIVGARGKGSRIWDVDGNEYIDLTNGFGVVLFGHHPEFVDAALGADANDPFLLGPRSPYAGEAAELIAELTGLPRVAFCNSGTEAVMAAIRLARARTGRSRIVMFEGSYHGHSDQTLAQSTLRDGAFFSEGIAPGIPPEAVAATTVLEYGSDAALEYIRRHADELAAVLVEPVQNMRLDLEPPVAFLRELRAITERAGAALVFDEMITGFRLHPAGAQGYFGIRADIATYGKVIGGGLPIGVVAGKAEFLDGIDGGTWRYGDDSSPAAQRTFFGGTFCQHPTAMIAAVATLREIKRRGPQMQVELNARTTAFAERLNGYFAREALPLHVAHFGSAFRINVPAAFDLLWYHLIERGVYVWEWRGCFLTTAHTDDDLDQVVRAIEGSVGALREDHSGTPGTPAGAPATAEFALTHAQRQMVALSEVHPNGALAYNMGFALTVHGELDRGQLQRAVDELVERHEALRTIVAPGGETQSVLPALAVPVEVVDFSSVDEEERERRLAAWFSAKNAAPVRLDRGPLVALHLLRCDPARHILVMTAHHCISDGWSMAGVVGELFALYEGRALEPALQFRDYVAWQQQFARSAEYARQELFWLDRLADELPVLALPFDRPRPAERAYRAARATLRLPAGETAAIKSFCAKHRCTLFIGLYAAYTALVHRIADQRDLIVGVPVAGRGLEGADALVGYCTHILPVRLAVDPDATFDEHLDAIKKTLAHAYEHQDYPFAALLERLQLGRDRSRVPLVSATFNLDKPTAVPSPPGLRLELTSHPVDFSDLELMLNVIDLGDELVIDCDYSAELFDAATAERLLEGYRTLLAAVVEDPARRIARLPIVGPRERTALAALDRAEAAAAGACVQTSFERHAALRPDAVALVEGDAHVTYRELNARANRIAHALIGLGVRPGALVGVCLEPSADLVAALLGVLKSGAAYVPIDPGYPRERIALLLGDAQPRAIVTTERARSLLPSAHGRLDLSLDEDRAAIDAQPHENPDVAMGLDEPAYVIYTSGSTGTPKGVLVSHRNLARLFAGTRRDFHFDEHDTWTLFHSFAFDFSVWEIFGALVHGGRLVVVPYWLARDPAAFYRLLCETGVTVLNQTPSAFRQLDAAEAGAGVDPRLRLRLVIFGGEALEPASLGPWFERHGDAQPRLVNMYGITETTVHVTYRPLAVSDANQRASRIGVPLADLRVHVLDRWMQPVPRGVSGEVYVGGAGVALGYLNNAALTRERFIPSPFHPGDRLYRSGDLARWTNDGELEYLGRADQQLKVRGFRIEPGEIESVLRAHPDVRDAVVLLREGANRAQLVAYVVGSVSPPALREFAAAKLPDYMLPAAFTSLDALPLTRNGKLDRAALPDPLPLHDDAVPDADPPRNPIEAQLVAIWSELLGAEKVGPHDNFFELGGDSIIGMQVASRARGAGLKLSLRDIHRHPTVAALARIAAEGEVPVAERAPARAEPATLVPIQRWFLAQRQPEPHHHHIALVLDVKRGLRAAALERALDAVIALHPALRTGFGADGLPFVVAKTPRSRVATYDAVEIAHVRETFGAETRLDEPPLVRAALFDGGPEVAPRLLLSVHHLVIDGVSTRILLDDLQSAYAQIERGEEPVLPPPSASPQAWAQALERAGREGAFAAERVFWDGVEGAALPRDFAPANDDTYAHEAHAVATLDGAETSVFLARATKDRADDLILSATVAALGRCFGDRILAIDVESHGREAAGEDPALDLTRSIGWFTSFHPVRVNARREGTAAEILREVQAARARIPHNGSGYLNLAYGSTGATLAPLGSVLFNYLGNVRLARTGGFVVGLADENGGRASSARNRRSHLLEINAYVAGDELRIDIAYLTSAHARATIEGLRGELATALRELLDVRPPPEGGSLRVAPASYGQERLWFLDRLEGESTAYYAQGAILLEGDLNVAALRAALAEIVRRHEVLRTTFQWSGDRLLQTVNPPLMPPFDEVDLRASGTDVQTEASAQNRKPFDLERGPLLRVALLRCAEREAVLVLTIHHIVTDGWSRGIVFKELTALYAAYLRGEPSPLAPLPLQYADFAERQRDETDAGAAPEALAYWRAQLDGAPELSTIASERPRANAGWRGALCVRDFPAELSAATVRLARSRGATTFMVLLSALSLLIARLSGRRDVVVGAPSAHRDRPELEPLIGFFVNALALRTDLSANPTFAELIDRVREVAVDAYVHQDVPFERVVEGLALHRDLGHSPLFQIFFNMQNVPEGVLELPGLRVSEYPVEQLVNRFDITLYALQDGERLRFELVYNECLFERARIERVLEQLQLVLEQGVARPETGIEEYTLVRETDRAVLPSRAAALVDAKPELLHEGFLRAATRAPDALAIADPAGEWTYRDLDAFSGRIAHWLLHAGCHGGDVVAVIAPASGVLVASIIGTLRAGGAFMIVDPATPPLRFAAMVGAARPAFLLDASGEALGRSFAGPRLEITGRTPQALVHFPGNGSSATSTPAIAPDQPAYVVFTSGSSGEPAGVLGSHAPVSHFLGWHIATFGLQPGDRFSLLSGVAHDPVLRDIFTPLWLGASLHVPAPDVRERPGALVRWLAETQIGVAHLTPPLAQLLLADEEEIRLPSLRYVFFGADRLTYGTVGALRRRAPDCRFANFYGTTETPQAVSFHVIEPHESDHRSPDGAVPIGRGIDGVQIVVRHGERMCGIGEPGEIFVRTPYLSTGYLDGDRSAGRFGHDHGVRIYRTGDIGCYRADGAVVLIGRSDAQVKVRGYRVEPREIEAALGTHAAVRRCYATAVERDGATVLVAFVAVRDPDLDGPACRGWLAERLPSYLVPAEVVIVGELPLTPNGKVDRDALLTLARERPEGPRRTALTGPLETALAKIWAEVLDRREGICADDDFFALGGHSLNAIRVLSRIARDLHVNLSLRTLFEHPRLCDLAAAIASERAEGQTQLVRIDAAERYPSSHAQRRLWSLVRLGDAAAYNMAGALVLEGALDRVAFAGALEAVIARHEALRTTFVTVAGELKQCIVPPGPPPLVTVDLRSEPNPLEAARAFAQRDARTAFTLADAPPVRVSLVQVADDRTVLVFNVHHIVADDWSIAVLVRELAAFYDAARRGTTVDRPELAVQYKDYAAWQERELATDRGERSRAFWHRALAAPVPVVDLPADFVRPPQRSGAGGRVPIRFDAALAAALERLAREHDATLYMVVLALVKVLLFRLSGERELIVGSPVAGRNHLDLEGQIGLYVNMLALRDELEPNAPFAAYLATVVANVRTALEHQEYPFDRLVAELPIARDVTRTPVFDVVVTLQNADAAEFRLDGLESSPFEVAGSTSKFDCTFLFEQRGAGLGGFLEYNGDLFLRERAHRMVAQLEELARSAVAAPEVALCALNILPATERALVCDVFNATAAAYPDGRTIVDLFEEQAAARAALPAVVCEDRSLTYAELDGRANALARALGESGVAPGELVGVLMERSELVPLAMLAVLKAGAAYVPIEPSYPAARIAAILEDAGCRVMLADRACVALGRDLFAGTIVEIEAGSAAAAPNPRRAIAMDDAAYVIYTSGSTGQPKGCVITHRNVVRLLKNEKFPFDFDARDVWAMTHSPAFDFSVWEMYGALLYGGRLVIVPRQTARDPQALRAFVRQHEITVFNQTPAAFYGFIAAEQQAQVHDLSSHLRYVIFGGDRLAPAQLRDWVNLYPLDRIRLVNMYGITETTVHVTFGLLGRDDIFADRNLSPIGVPLPETAVFVCDTYMNPQPIGVPGELYIGGTGVCREYLGLPDLTAARFVPSPFAAGERLYRSGDLGFWRADGTLVYVGRNDRQVQIRGYRVELDEIAAALEAHPAVQRAVVALWQPPDDARDLQKRIVAWVVRAAAESAERPDLRAHVRATLPEFMVPAHVIAVEELPLGPNGKVDVARLPVPEATAGSSPAPDHGIAARIAALWRSVLRCGDVGLDDNFFDLGGHSLLLIEVHRLLVEWHGADIPLVELFRYPTVRALAAYLERGSAPAAPARTAPVAAAEDAIAIVGLAGRFPGADGIERFWQNLCAGVESNVLLSDEELRAAGVPAHVIADPRYVRNKPVLAAIDEFDADFFGIAGREAAIIDPQHRLFLECAWEAFENAGYDPGAYPGRVGVFAAASINSYLLTNLFGNKELIESLGVYPLLIGNDRDFLATRVSYKLNLKGPALVVGTACSGSMVAVHLAVQSLKAGECEMALAGGVSVKVPQHEGYLYEEGGILSPDGHCRAFDADANGTVGGSGVGIAVLKRLRDAVRDGDHVYAVIRGIAVGNDGSEKVGYTAPSVAGQAEVITRAHELAGVDPESIGYVEAHGTGTSLGDPIEIAALTQAFRTKTAETGFCAIGSVKPNIGHLDAAAGIAGLVKAALALDRAQLPPSLNCEEPNPQAGFAASPFFVNARLRAWERTATPRRAGVSSFGLGGTNVHAILEEAPVAPALPAVSAALIEPALHLVQLSAPSAHQLDALAENVAAAFESTPDLDLRDAAYTLAVGRRAFEHRLVLVAANPGEAARELRARDPGVVRAARAVQGRPVAFMFPGGGAQHVAMGRALYEREPAYRAAFDRCADALIAHAGHDLRDVLLARSDEAEMRRPAIGLPALFAVEYAVAQLLLEYGVVPQSMIGHSMGEYAAAVLAGTFTLDDALALVALRGKLFERIGSGAMLSVALAESELVALLAPPLAIAAVNLPQTCVVSGPSAEIDALAVRLEARGIDSRRLSIDAAAHSALVEPILDDFRRLLGGLTLAEPVIPFVSNVTGTWIRADQATDPEYWAMHMRQTVRFADGIGELLRDPRTLLLEVGPGNTLTSLAQRHPDRRNEQPVLRTMRRPDESTQRDDAVLLTALGRLWSEGVPVDRRALHPVGRRVPLPGLVFERTRYWIEPPDALVASDAYAKRPDVADWLYVPAPRRSALARRASSPGSWLVVRDAGGLGERVAERLRAGGHAVSIARPGDPLPAGSLPEHVLFAAALDGAQHLDTLVALARACVAHPSNQDVDLCVLTERAQDVGGEAQLDPDAAAFIGPVLVIGQEQGKVRARAIDLQRGTGEARLLEDVAAELLSSDPQTLVAYRAGHRWTRGYASIALDRSQTRLREGGVYLITGGTGGVGNLIATFLAREYRARLGLFARRPGLDAAELERIAALGGAVTIIPGDVGDLADVRRAVGVMRARYGGLHGVIHAAGATTGASIFQPFETLPAGSFAEQAYPKLRGAQLLAEALDGEPLDFVLSISSNAALLGGLGLTAYAAASASLDLFAAARSRESTVPWISSGWDGWPTARRAALDPAEQTSLDRLGMSVRECEEALRLVLAAPPGHVVVSASDVQARLARWTTYAHTRDDAPATPVRGALPPVEAEEPADPLARQIARLWREMLGVQHVGLRDNFFELRGDSLLGSRLITRLGILLGLRVPLRTLFEAPTVAGLAERIAALRDAAGDPPSETLPILPVPDRESHPLAPAQRRLWLLSQVDGGSRAYHIALALRLGGELDGEALARAIESIGERHESLRTSFHATPSGPVQRIRPRAPWSLETLDLSLGADPEDAAERASRELADAPFDLENGALVRFRLLRLAPARHELVMVVHHIVADGWSLSVLARELGTLYNAFHRRATVPLAPLRIHYRDYAAWAAAGREEDRDYWLDRLRLPLPLVSLPTDYPRPAVRGFRGAIVNVAFDGPERDALEGLARHHDASLFMVLCALVKVLIFRYTGARDIIVGTPVAGRSHPDLDDQIGFYLNTIVLRDELDPQSSFAEFLRAVRGTAVDAYAHEAYPFDELVDAVGASRDASRSPLFDVQVSMQNAGRLNVAFDGIEIVPRALETGESKCDLAFDFDASEAALLVGIRYDSALFAPATAGRLAEHLRELARSAAADPNRSCALLEMLPETERAAVLGFVEGPARELPAETLLDRFAANVARHPDRIAARFAGECLTYRELDVRSNRVANELRAGDLGAGALVGVCLERSLEMLASLLGVLKAGCAYVPIDPLYPDERIAVMLQKSGATLILVQRETRERLASVVPNGCTLVAVDADAAVWQTSGEGPLVARVQPDDLAYVLFTSGSTGVPKGVEIEHRALFNFLLSMESTPGIGSGDALLAVTTISFDIAGLELYLPLFAGAQVVIAETELTRDGSRLAERLDRGDISIVQATPATWNMLLAAGWRGRPDFTILCGGEALTGTLARALLARCGALWNLYGPTETTIWSAVHRVSEADCGAAHVTLGRPIHNTRIAILDGARQPVPIGVAGDLFIGGRGVARGYRGQPELTAERFSDDPMASNPGARMYKTGDIARFAADGTIAFLGRSDHQVKVRGHRIELDEVEAAILRFAAVREAVVTCVNDGRGEAALCAYVVARDRALDTAALRTHLGAIVPAYMIPSAFVVLAALPLGPSGKVNRSALPAPAEIVRVRSVAPRTALEGAIATIWRRVLELDEIGVDDDFFELGGHSLKATHIVFGIQAELGLSVTLTDIFRSPNIAGLARALEARQAAAAPSPGDLALSNVDA